MNTYGYVGGNPISFTDPSGLCPMCIPLIPAGIEAASAVVSAVIGIATGEAMYNTASSNLQEQIEREANKNEYKNICNEPPPPNLDPCELAKWKLNKAQRCKAAKLPGKKIPIDGGMERTTATILNSIKIWKMPLETHKEKLRGFANVRNEY